MLKLTRRIGETIVIQSDIEVTVLDIKGHQVRIGIKAPKDVAVVRSELLVGSSPAGDRQILIE